MLMPCSPPCTRSRLVGRLEAVVSVTVAESPAGVWVCSTEMILSLPRPLPPITYRDGVTIVSALADVSYALQHGAIAIDEHSHAVTDILYRQPRDAVQRAALADGLVPLASLLPSSHTAHPPQHSGLTFFTPRAAEALLALHVLTPLDACTYIGRDNGAPAAMLRRSPRGRGRGRAGLAGAGRVSQPGAGRGPGRVCGGRSRCYWQECACGAVAAAARHSAVLRARGWCAVAVTGPRPPHAGARHLYMTGSLRQHAGNVRVRPLVDVPPSELLWSSRAHAIVPAVGVAESAAIINSLVDNGVVVGANALLSHCWLHSDV